MHKNDGKSSDTMSSSLDFAAVLTLGKEDKNIILHKPKPAATPPHPPPPPPTRSEADIHARFTLISSKLSKISFLNPDLKLQEVMLNTVAR